MINRELIRIKTVQLLYSYLLVEHPFSLESQPSAPTKEKRFAYALYLDLLLLLARVAANVDRRNGHPLEKTRFVRNILSDDRIKGLMVKYEAAGFPFAPVEADLAAAVKESAIYRNFLKNRDSDTGNDENVWKELFERVLMTDPAVNRLISERETFTLKGVDRMRGLMEDTFSNFFASADNLHDALKILSHSLDKTRELYFRLLALPIAITTLREREIDNAQYKLLKRDEDVNPSLRFVDNEFVAFLRSDPDVQNGISKYHIDWLSENEGMVKSLWKLISQSDIYRNYLEFPATDLKMDCTFWRDVLRFLVFVDDEFLEAMEDRSVFWNDDLDVIGTFVLKSIKRLGDRGDYPREEESFVLPMFKDREDAEFGAQLFRDVLRNKDYLRGLILESVDRSQWEVERLAFMDTVIMMTALAEILNFPKIPLTVSFNEYIEIAKHYSTPRSGVFINGLLGNIVASLREKGVLLKSFNTDKKK